MSLFLRCIFLILSMTVSLGVFAANAPTKPLSVVTATGDTVSTGSIVATESGSVDMNASGSVDTASGISEEEDAARKDKEKTINDINTFLIESYKLKIDKILSNLNISLERVTDNDPIAQAKLLEKIRNDIDTKIQVINTRTISENRKKILSSIFSYIQENLDAKISKLVQDK